MGRKRNPMTVYLFVCLAEGCAWCFISAGEGRGGVQAFTFCVPVITPDEAPEEPHALLRSALDLCTYRSLWFVFCDRVSA